MAEQPSKPANDTRGADVRSVSSIYLGDHPPVSASDFLNRLIEARNSATKESNKFLLVGIVLAALSLIKMVGLTLDLTFIGIQTSKVPYGLFFFIVLGEIALMLSAMRAADARAYDHDARLVINRAWPDSADWIARTFPNIFEWFAPASNAVARSHSALAKAVMNCVSLATVLLGSALMLAPAILGIVVVAKWRTYITEGDVALQYWIIVVATALSVFWFIAYGAVHAVTDKADELGGFDGDQIPRRRS